MSVEIKADIRHWLRELDKKYFFVMLGFAVMVYFPLISQRLVNTFDGLWNGSWFIGGFWELSIGRCCTFRCTDGTAQCPVDSFHDGAWHHASAQAFCGA